MKVLLLFTLLASLGAVACAEALPTQPRAYSLPQLGTHSLVSKVNVEGTPCVVASNYGPGSEQGYYGTPVAIAISCDWSHK